MTEREVMREVVMILGEAFDKLDELPKFVPPSDAYWAVVDAQDELETRGAMIVQLLIDMGESE